MKIKSLYFFYSIYTLLQLIHTIVCVEESKTFIKSNTATNTLSSSSLLKREAYRDKNLIYNVEKEKEIVEKILKTLDEEQETLIPQFKEVENKANLVSTDDTNMNNKLYTIIKGEKIVIDLKELSSTQIKLLQK